MLVNKECGVKFKLGSQKKFPPLNCILYKVLTVLYKNLQFVSTLVPGLLY